MKRREFLKKLSLGASAGIIAGAPAIATAQNKKFRWRMALAVPKTLPIWGVLMQQFAKNVESLSEKQLRIRVYGAGELVPALETFDAVKKGEIQMGHSASYYWQGKIPATPFFCSVPFGMRTRCFQSWLNVGDGQRLWNELMAPHGVICMSCGGTGYQSPGWFNKEINSVDDLKGLKIRIPGLASKVYAKLGATPVLLPGGEIFTGLSTGVIDAVEWVGPYHDYTMGFHKAAKYLYGDSWHEPGALLELMINKSEWEKLPEHLQHVIRYCVADIERQMITEFETKNAEYYEKLKGISSIELKHFPVSVLKQFEEASEEAKLEIAQTSPLAKRIYDSYTAFQKSYEEFQNFSSEAFCGHAA